MNKRRYSNRRRKNILRVFILLMTIIITVVMWRTIKIDVQVGELTLPKILQSEKSFADTSGEWNLILVDRNHYIPNNYQVELTELSNGKKVDSRIYPELQQMFNDAYGFLCSYLINPLFTPKNTGKTLDFSTSAKVEMQFLFCG